MDPNFERAWYDQKDFAINYPETKLQAAIVTQCLNSNSINGDVIDSFVTDLKRRNGNSGDSNVKNNRCSSKSTVANVIGYLNGPVTRTMNPLFSYEHSLQDAIRFVEDLECFSLGEQQHHTHVTVVPATHDGIPSHREGNEHQPQIAPNSGRRYQFQTAKNQFETEGGTFKRPRQEERNALSDEKANHIQRKVQSTSSTNKEKNDLPPELQHCEKELVEKVEAEIIQHGQPITFDDIAGLEFAKKCVQELICWPMLRPDIFKGLRALPRGLLLFGPPGTGKTLIGKAIANQAGATFFAISSSSLTSKWIGEGEKAVKTLFAVAVFHQPAVVFIDEVDSLLCQRSAEENEASRRIKTEFLVQLDGAGTNADAQVVVIGATNRPEELDEAARRRFVKRLYIPLPDDSSRQDLLHRLIRNSRHSLCEGDMQMLVNHTAGFSGADIRSLCTEAAMGPVREIAIRQGGLRNIREEDVPPITAEHFQEALSTVTTSVSTSDLQRYIDWNSQYGSYRRME